jgi:flagellar protein FliJ
MAKRFHFPLETLLRVRELREREAKRKVGLKQAEIARLDQLNRETAEEILRRQEELRARQQGAFTTTELMRERAWIAYLRRTIHQRQMQRVGLVEELEGLRRVFLRARTQKRIIDKLRERRWEEYSQDRKRREQSEADDLARMLHGYEGIHNS